MTICGLPLGGGGGRLDNSESSALPLKVEVRTVSPSVLLYKFVEIWKILIPNFFSLIFKQGCHEGPRLGISLATTFV